MNPAPPPLPRQTIPFTRFVFTLHNRDFLKITSVMEDCEESLLNELMEVCEESLPNQSSSAQEEDVSQLESETPNKVKKNSSWIWKHTTLIQVKGQLDRYKCTYCEKTFVRSGTGTISRHLRNKHSEKMKNSPSKAASPSPLKNKHTEKRKNSPSTLKKVKEHSSWIWKHTTLIKVEDQPDRYKCMYCEKTFVKSGTSTISRHLINKHAEKMKNSPPKGVISNHLKNKRPEKMKNSSSTSKKVKIHSSWIWKHTTLIKVEDQPDRYRCMYCEKTFVKSGTGSISRHLMNKHTEKMNDTQCTPTNSGKSVFPFKFNNEKSQQDFLQFIVSNNHPFSLGEDPAFRRFIFSLQPLYKPMGRTAVKDKLMSTFIESRDKVIAILQGRKVALTTDLWTSPNKLAFMGVTVSLITEKFKPINAIIGFKQVLGERSGINIGDTFFDTIKLFDLQERMLSITTDYASSNESFIDHIIHLTKNNSQPFNKDMWIRCFAYVLNICVQTILEIISKLLQKLRDLINSIRASPQTIQKFEKILETCELHNEDYEDEEFVFTDGSVITNDLLPILDCKTRWSSGYFFVKRSVKLRSAIDEIAKEEADLRKHKMSEEDWRILDQVLEFLEEFAIITKYIEGSEYPTLSLVVPMYNRLLVILEDVSQNRHESITHPLIVKGVTAGLQKLSSYYDKASPIVMAATFMDPRLKMQYFIENGWNCAGESRDAFQATDEKLIRSRVKPAIQSVWKNYKETPTINTGTKNVAVPKRPAFNQSYIANILGKNRVAEKIEMDEIDEYEAERTERADSDPTAVYTYWANRSCRWPHLGRMAKDILSIPAKSAASEMGFSTGKDVFGIARMSLKPEVVEALICLRSWYKAELLGEKEAQGFLEENFDDSLLAEEEKEDAVE